MHIIPGWISSWSIGGKLSLIWFILISGLIVWVSTKLVKNLGIISAKTKLNDSFLGGVFIAIITSTPELITEITQALNLTPEVGIADDVGSNGFAIFLIAISAIVFLGELFLNKLKSFTKLSLWISTFVMAIFTIFLVINKDFTIGTSGVFAFGLIPLGFFIFWIISLFISYKYGDSDEVSINKLKDISVLKAVSYFVIWGLLLVFLSLSLNWVVLSIEQGYQFGTTIAGGIFLAISTSLPEIIVFFIMLSKGYRSGALLALIGSQIFNLAISFFGDLFYKEATFNLESVGRIWPLALLGTLMIALISGHVSLSRVFPKIFNQKKYYLIIPISVTVGYIVGWILISLYWI